MKRGSIRAFFVVLAVSFLPSSIAAAQAWVNAKGELSLALRSDYQTSTGVWHGSTLVSGLNADSVNSAFAAEYVPIEKLALGIALNTNGARYSGPQVIPGATGFILAHGSQDDGSYHWNVTDLDVEARYQAYEGAVTLTPVLRFRVPVTKYEQKGYAAAGSHLAEASAGFYLGRYGLGLEDLVLQLGYTFTYVAKETGGGAATSKYRVNRSDVDLSLAYVINEKLMVGAGAVLRYTHDGFDLTDYPGLPPGDPLIMWHDPVLKARYFAPALIASYQISPSWAVLGRFAKIVWGENVSDPLSFGLTLNWANNLAE
jgi:hypothetical protein